MELVGISGADVGKTFGFVESLRGDSPAGFNCPSCLSNAGRVSLRGKMVGDTVGVFNSLDIPLPVEIGVFTPVVLDVEISALFNRWSPLPLMPHSPIQSAPSNTRLLHPSSSRG